VTKGTACLLAILALTGCAHETTSGRHVEFWTMALKPTFTGYIQSTLAAFEKQHPGVTVTWVDVPGSAIEDKTISAVSSGTSPDLVNLNPDFSQRLGSKGALLDLTASLSADVKARYFPSALEATSLDGKIIGIPWYLSTQVSIVNRALWRKAGLDRVPTDYRGLAALAPRLKAIGAVPVLPNLGDSIHLLELLAMDGVPLLTPDRRHPAFDTPVGRKSFRFWVGLFTSGTLPKEALSLDHREIIDRFMSGQSAVLGSGPQFLKTIRDNAPQLYKDLDVGPQVGGTSGRVGVSVMNLVIPTICNDPQDALDLALFITNGENQLAFCKLAGILPSVKSAAADPFFQTLGATASIEDRARKVASTQLLRSALLVPPMPHQNDLKRAMNEAFQRAALGQQSADEALKQAAADWERILASP
jgi:putative chitobiose transport system substrate-binding protein